ncbi:Exocyst complex component 2 [Tetrabaena socialis]|uniref:Exocyst complex component SEC5 n=1 Tax=Tetrabaena socialis TaxID=47790 RepID=A0A2J8A7K3_9CHLO|nr:Exocyst complex component 2 [Tetrabaena socialis]|eukprot:PNH08526.1 Exocyst complex component 2 [Tetrabaena socialis]
MGDAESDVSAISLSDDDVPARKAPAARKPSAAAGGRAAAAGGSRASGGEGKRKKGRVAFQLPASYEGDDDEGWDAEGGHAHYHHDAAEAEAEDLGPVEDESKPLGWSYFRKRDASEGPIAWDEVDAGELAFVAESLVRTTTMRTANQADDVLQQIFQEAPGEGDAPLVDPLGRGIIDPVTMTLGKKPSRRARAAQPVAGEKGLKATMRTFHTARLGAKGQQGSDASAGPGGRGAAAHELDEETRKVLPNQEGFEPEAYLAAFHQESSMGQLEKGLRSLSRELSERTGQLKLLIRNNFDRFINCKDAIDDIHAKLRKMLIKAAPPAGAGAGAGGAAAAAAAQQQQSVGTDRVYRSLEQVEGQARRTFGPILERAAKADRIRAVSGLLQRFDTLFAAPQRVLQLAGRGELEQVVREYKRANTLIRPTPTTARVWVSLYAEIEKRVTEVYLAVRQLVTEPPLEARPGGQAAGPVFSSFGEPADEDGAGGGGATEGEEGGDSTQRQRLHQLPEYLLFLVLMRQVRSGVGSAAAGRRGWPDVVVDGASVTYLALTCSPHDGLDLLAADHQPVTPLPRRLEEEVGVALLHYQWPLGAVAEAAGGPDGVPSDSSWRPMQGSVFACFSLLSEALAEYARSLYGNGAGGGGGDGGGQRAANGSSRATRPPAEADASAAPDPASTSSKRRAGLLASSTAAGGTSMGGSASAAAEALEAGGASGGGAADSDGGAGPGSLWSAAGSSDVRVLLVISNSAVIRTRVMPGVAERYRRLLAPTPEATLTSQRRVRDLTTAMRRSNESLGSSYLGRKEADIAAAVRRYVAAETAPLLAGGGAVAAEAAAGQGSRAAGKAAGGRMLAGPGGPSAGCCSLLQLLTAIHNEALAYSPSE